MVSWIASGRNRGRVFRNRGSGITRRDGERSLDIGWQIEKISFYLRRMSMGKKRIWSFRRNPVASRLGDGVFVCLAYP